MPVRLNVVAYGSFEKTLDSVQKLLELQKNNQPEVRLLNNLSNLSESQQVIQKIIENLGATEVNAYQRAGSSNVTSRYITLTEKVLSVKLAFPYFLNNICESCSIKDKCYEGFYGVRLERLRNNYYVRLCIYKQNDEILMPWNEFINRPVSEEIRMGSIFY